MFHSLVSLNRIFWFLGLVPLYNTLFLSPHNHLQLRHDSKRDLQHQFDFHWDWKYSFWLRPSMCGHYWCSFWCCIRHRMYPSHSPGWASVWLDRSHWHSVYGIIHSLVLQYLLDYYYGPVWRYTWKLAWCWLLWWCCSPDFVTWCDGNGSTFPRQFRRADQHNLQ